jgi:transcriptional antiterminator RfaH
MSKWYVVYSHASRENEAFEHLKRQGFEAYLPKHLKTRRHARRKEQVLRPLFPRYLFVRLDLDYSPWRAINSTRGVIHLICHGEEPASLPDGLIEEMRGREDDLGSVVSDISERFKFGEAVQVISGAMIDRIGLFQCRTDGDRVVVLFKLLGREMKLTLPGKSIWSPA